MKNIIVLSKSDQKQHSTLLTNHKQKGKIVETLNKTLLELQLHLAWNMLFCYRKRIAGGSKGSGLWFLKSLSFCKFRVYLHEKEESNDETSSQIIRWRASSSESSLKFVISCWLLPRRKIVYCAGVELAVTGRTSRFLSGPKLPCKITAHLSLDIAFPHNMRPGFAVAPLQPGSN